jgi:hypothetical protein
MSRWFLLVALLAACGDANEANDVLGPFSGQTHRFVVDAIDLPLNSNDARNFGGDVDGDGMRDNQLGLVLGTLSSEDNLTTHGKDMIAAGRVRLIVEITADDLVDDPTVGVRIIGDESAPLVELGGTLVNGTFVSNRTATTKVPGKASLVLPVFADADPSILPLEQMQLELTIENGMVTGLVQGAADPMIVANVAYDGAVQMLAARPQSHRMFMVLFETPPRDFVLEREEFVNSALLKALLEPDVTLDGREMVSFGFRIHARACATGACMDGVAFDRCFDRLPASSETGIDCGGACERDCGGGEGCAAAADCQSRICGGDGTCAGPRCDDGVKDGFETDLDCGSACTGCALGLTCYYDSDCASGQCGPPCPEGELCFPTEETCVPAP